MLASRLCVLFVAVPAFLSSCGKSGRESDPGPEAHLQLLAARAAFDERAAEIGRQSRHLQRQVAGLEAAIREQESADLRERLEALRVANQRLAEEADAMRDRDLDLEVFSNTGGDIAIPLPDLVSADTFHSRLEPHGDWLRVPDYGEVWRPQLSESPAWRPYLDGHWNWSQQGWSWATTEPFGGICYHYGRWVRLPAWGWVWVPGSEWAPAWVSWRSNADCVGWAPLPPSPAGWRGGFDSGCDSALSISAGAYVFIETRHFVRDSYRSCAMPTLRVAQIFHRTTNVTSIVQLNARNRFVFVQCGGPERPRIEQACRQPVPRHVFPGQPLPHRLPESPPRLASGQVRSPTLTDAFAIAAQSNRLVSAGGPSNPAQGVVAPAIQRELPGPMPALPRPAFNGEQPGSSSVDAGGQPTVVTAAPARPAAVTYVGRVDQKAGPLAVAHRPPASGTLTGLQQTRQRQALEAEQERQRQLAEQRLREQVLNRQQAAEEEARLNAMRAEQDRRNQLVEQARLAEMKTAQDQERERQRQLLELADRQRREMAQRAEQERQHQMAEQAERQRRERETAVQQAAERERQRQMVEQAERQRREMAQRAEQEKQRQIAEQAERQRRERETAVQQAAERERQRQMMEQAERQRREMAQRAEQERQRQMAEQAERLRRDRETAMQQAAGRERQRQMVEQAERQRRDITQRIEQERPQRASMSRSRGVDK